MKTALNWPVEIIHEKCRSSIENLQISVRRITINRRGTLEFGLHCFVCHDTFTVLKHMLELTTLAALKDQEYAGDDVNPMQRIGKLPSN